MKDYVIVTDSGCDLEAGMAKDLELEALPLTILLDGKNYANYLDGREIGFKEFYDALRAGKDSKSSAVNVEVFTEFFKSLLDAGKDILYLGFSSGLSGTYQAGVIAADDLRAEYPDRKILTADTLCASLGQALILYLAVEKKRAGATMEEVKAFIEETRPNLCHWVMADDLNHLKRGGRVSAAAAFFGSALNIKPIIHMDDEGKLQVMDKVRGRKNAIRYLYDKMKDTALDLTGQTIFICHADCYEDARALGDLILAEQPVKDVFINYIGPVIGTHTGPGTMALFFLGKQR